MDQQIFSDGIGQVTIVGGTVRLDFVVYSPTEKDAKGQPAAVFCQRIVMGVDGFLRSAEKIQEATQALAKLSQRPRETQPAQSRLEIVEPLPAVTAPVESPAPKPVPPTTPAKRPFP